MLHSGSPVLFRSRSKLCTSPRPCALQLETIQSRLLDVGAAVATPRPTSADHKLQVGGEAAHQRAYASAHAQAIVMADRGTWLRSRAANLSRHACRAPSLPQRTAFSDVHTAQLEGWIDEMDKSLPPLTQFILPSGVGGGRRIVTAAVRERLPLP